MINHCRGHLFAGINEFKNYLPTVQWGPLDYIQMLLLTFTRLGHQFVIVFFIVSGFCISHSLANRTGTMGFYLRRLVRLYPPYLGGLALAALAFVSTQLLSPHLYNCSDPAPIAQKLCGSKDFLQFSNILRDLIYLPYGTFIPQYWSLTHEVIFYLLVPFLLLARFPYLILSAILFIVGCTQNNPGSPLFSTILGRYVFIYNFYFATGVLLYRHWPLFKRLFKLPRRIFPAVCILVFLVMLGFDMVERIPLHDTFSCLVAAALSLLLIVNMNEHEILFGPLVWVGEFSYTLYVTHIATIFLVISILAGPLHVSFPIYARWLWLIGIPVSLAAAYGMYLCIEKPTKALLKRMRTVSKIAINAAPISLESIQK
jgi:peptidoglycan/LPS O-acetylase OafA/YrhL